MDNTQTLPYRWPILALTVLTATLVAAAPLMALPVLFHEISLDLGLNLVQIGFVWGAGSVAGIFVSLVAGTLGDRFGNKRTLVVASLLAGVTGVLPGLATDYATLLLAIFLFGLVRAVIPINLHKTCAVWFSSRELGLANGFVSTGMALGFLIGSLLSATLLSPALGGWRQVMFFYAGLAGAICLLWLATRSPTTEGAALSSQRQATFGANLVHVARLPVVWLLGLAMLGFSACVQGTLGYLPLHLRAMGWPAASADSALATFHAVSMFATVPMALASDRLEMRRSFLIAGSGLLAAGVGLLALASGPVVWIAVILAGLMRDGFMAIFMTSVMEVRGVGVAYAGTAMGLTMMVGGIGRFVSPPIGNSLAGSNASLPFVFWAGMALVAVMVFLLVGDMTTGDRLRSG